jgi:glycosyltransferase involved in cell wall biosynthesis
MPLTAPDPASTARKNILIFGHSYPAQFTDINNLYTKLFDNNKYAVTVAYLTGEPDEAVRKKHLAENVIFFNASRKTARGAKFSLIKKIARLQHEKNFTLVIAHRYKPTYIMLLAALFAKFPAIISVMHAMGTMNSLARKLFIALLARNNFIFAGVSNAVRDDLRQTCWRMPAARVATLYNSLDIDVSEKQLFSRAAAREKLNLPQEQFVFGHVGRLVTCKDQQTLITAFSRLKAQNISAKLVIIGAGALEKPLKKLTADLNLSADIIFSGFIADAFQLMPAFDAFVLPSIEEAFGIVLLEAMIARTPVIATKVNGIPELITDAGLLVNPADPAHLAAQMLALYQMPAEQLNLLANKGYERVTSHFSLQQFKKTFWQLPLVNRNLL